MNVLAVAVHPDDETLGCGATLLKHKAYGDTINWVIFTNLYEQSGKFRQVAGYQKTQIDRASEAYGFDEVIQLGFPATTLHQVNFTDMLYVFKSAIEKIRPEIIYTVNRSDIHTDHRFAASVVASAIKSFRAPYIKQVLMYECLSETEAAPCLPEKVFIPQIYNDVTPYINEKVKIMRLYNSEMQKSPMPRSKEAILAQARFRGAAMAIEYAEAFMILKYLL